MKNKLNILFLIIAGFFYSSYAAEENEELVQYVNPLIGTVQSETVSVLKSYLKYGCVPQGIEGLIPLTEGTEEFNKNHNDFFTEGLLYWHGNEPGHQIPFLYTYFGQSEKTRTGVAKSLNEEYSAIPGGLCGNDYMGKMSAFAASGLYPVTPGTGEYVISAPIFKKAQRWSAQFYNEGVS